MILKKHNKHIAFFIIIFFTLILHLTTFAAKFYWVGGNGQWSDYQHHWATTSGGNVFQTAEPTSVDDVYFDKNSFTALSDTVVVGDPTINMHHMKWLGTVAGATFICGANINIFGSIYLAPSMNFDNTGGTTTFETVNQDTIFTGGTSQGTTQVLKGVNFNGTGTWILESFLNVDNDINLYEGTLISKGNGIECSKFSSKPPVNTYKRILNITGSTIEIKSSDNNPYKSWEVDNLGKSIRIYSSGSLIQFRGSTGLCTMICGCGLHYNDEIFMFSDGLIEDCTDTLHDATFLQNGTVEGDMTIFHNISVALDGVIDGTKDHYNDVTISGNGTIGQDTSLYGNSNNTYTVLRIGLTGLVYGNYNTFKDIHFSTAKICCGCLCEETCNCTYCGATTESELHGDDVYVKDSLEFFRDGGIFGGSDTIHRCTFWCDGWIFKGSNRFDILEIYRQYQECFNSAPDGSTLESIHSNVLTLQSNKTQTVTTAFNLKGNILCGNTLVESTNTGTAANLYSIPTLSLLYAQLQDIHGTNKTGIMDTARISINLGDDPNWKFPSPYAPVLIDSVKMTKVSPCYNSVNGDVKIYAEGGNGKLKYAILIVDTTGNNPSYWLFNTKPPLNDFPNLYKFKWEFLVEDSLGCLAEIYVTVGGPSKVVIDSTKLTNVTCANLKDGKILVYAKGGTGSLNYSPNGGNFFKSSLLTKLDSGMYNVTVKDSLGCIATKMVNLTQPIVLNLYTQGSLDTIKCRGDKQGNMNLTALGGTMPYHFEVWNKSSEYNKDTIFRKKLKSDTIELLGLYGGNNYEALVIDSLGCRDSVYFDITQPDSLVLNTVKQPETCFGGSNASIKIYHLPAQLRLINIYGVMIVPPLI